VVLAEDVVELGEDMVVAVVVDAEEVEAEEEGVEVVEDVEVEDVEVEEVLVVPATEARRDFNSLFSFLVSVRFFSRVSMCTLNSACKEDSLAIFCANSWFSVINPFVLSSRSLIYSFLRCLDSAADCLFFNNLSCLFLVLSSSDLNSTLSFPPRSLAEWISDAEAARSSRESKVLSGLNMSNEEGSSSNTRRSRASSAGATRTTKTNKHCYCCFTGKS